MELKKEIAQLAELGIKSKHTPKPFVAGLSEIPVTGKIFGKQELENALIENDMVKITLSDGYSDRKSVV